MPIGGRRTLAGLYTRDSRSPHAVLTTVRASLTTNFQCAMQRVFTDRYRTRTDQSRFPMTGSQRILCIRAPTTTHRRLATPCCSPLAPRMLRRNTRRHTNSRYPSRAISRRAADGTKSGGPATARPRVKPVGSGRHMPRIPGRRRRCADRRPPVRCASHFGATPRSLRPREPRVSNGVPDTAPTRVIDDRHSVRRVAARGSVGRYPVPFDNRG